MTSREEALNQILVLAETHNLSASEITRAMKDKAPSIRNRAPLFLAAIGGIFIFSGIAAFISMFWDEMNSLSRVIITLGSGFALYIIGLAVVREGRFPKASAPLLCIAAALQPTGLLVLIDEYFNRGGDERYALLFVFGVMLIQQIATFTATRQSVLLFFSLLFGAGFFSTAFSLLGVPDEWNAIFIGLSLLGIAGGLAQNGYPRFPGFWFFMGGSTFLGGLFWKLHDSSIELLYLFICCILVYLSTVARSTALMVVSVIAMLSYIAYFTQKHFVDSIGWPASLVFLGLVFVGAAAGALRIKKKYINSAA